MTAEGKAWMEAALDPFHDSAINPVGYPDAYGGRTIVQTINQQYTIAAPGAVNWDCHIFNNNDIGLLGHDAGGVNQFAGSASGANLNANTFALAGTSIPMGFVNMRSCTSGIPTTGGVASFAAASVTGQTANLNVQITPDTQCRLLGFGIEVHNTTAQLYRQGVVTCYRMPQQTTVGQQVGYVSGGAGFINSSVVSNIAPGSLAQATLLTNSCTWNAEDGAYLIGTQSGVENPFQALNAGQRVFVGYAGLGLCEMSFSSAAISAGAGVGNAPPFLAVPFDTVGAYFTGLSPQTTLQVYVRAIVEFAPTPVTNPTLVSLARPDRKSVV